MRKWISIAATLLTLSYAHADTPPARAINAETYDAAGNGITSHLNGSSRGLDEYNINPVGAPINTQIIWSGSAIDPRQVSVANFPATQNVNVTNASLAVTGTVTANIGTTNGLALDSTTQNTQGSASGGTAASKSDLAGGIYNATPPILTNGQQASLQFNSSGSLRVDGSAFTQPVSGSVSVSNFPASQTVNGSVSVSNFPATQPVSGTVSVSNLPSLQPVQVSDGTLNLALLNSAPASDTGQTAIPVRVISQLGAGGGGSSGASFALQTDTFAATGSGTTVDVHTGPVKFYSLQVVATGSVSSWIVVLDCSMDGVNFSSIPNLNATSGSGSGAIQFTGGAPYPCAYFRSRVTTLSLGTGTNIVVTVLGQN